MRRLLLTGPASTALAALTLHLAGPARGSEPAAATSWRPGQGAAAGLLIAAVEADAQDTLTLGRLAHASDMAVLVVEAADGVCTESRRLLLVLQQAGVRGAVLAINTPSLAALSEDLLAAVIIDFEAVSLAVGIEPLAAVPIAAQEGANVLRPAGEAAHHDRRSLLDTVLSVAPSASPRPAAVRLRVEQDLGRAGKLASVRAAVVSGALTPGTAIVTLPGGALGRAVEVQAVGSAGPEPLVEVAVETDAPIPAGSILAEAAHRPELADQAAAHIVWTGRWPLLPGRSYVARSPLWTVNASVSRLKHKISPDTIDHVASHTLSQGEVGSCNVAFEREVAFDPADENPATSRFELADRLTGEIVGLGYIDFPLRRATNIHWQALAVDKPARAKLKDQQPCCLWFTGLSGSGKSTVASLLEKRLHALGRHTYTLDGDNVRHGLCRDLGFTDADRVENIRRVAEVARLFVEAGLIVMVSFISPFRAERQLARDLFPAGEFVEIFVDAPLEVCEARDPKGLYRKARSGALKNFTGIDSAYEAPVSPELRLDAASQPAEALVEHVLDELRGRGFV
ncbi:MAG: adenylyl-sulfate kinase [Hyphomicrobiaceae bacterium]